MTKASIALSELAEKGADVLGGHFKLYRTWPLENVPARA
jgi:hypothetical protein